MVLNDRNRYIVSSLLGFGFYILFFLVLMLFGIFKAPSSPNFSSLVYIDLGDNPVLLPVNNDDKDTKGTEEVLTPRMEDDASVIETPASIQNTQRIQEELPKQNPDKITESSTNAGSASSFLSAAAAIGTANKAPGETGGAPIVDSGNRGTAQTTVSQSSSGAPRTFSSGTTTNKVSALTLPDLTDTKQNDDFFEKENVSVIKGANTGNPVVQNQSQSSSGSPVEERYQSTPVVNNSIRNTQGNSSTEGFGVSSGAGTSERGGTQNGTINQSQIILDNTTGKSSSTAVTGVTGTGTGTTSTNDYQGRSGGVGSDPGDSSGKIGNSTGTGSSQSTEFNFEWDGQAASNRVVLSSPSKSELISDLSVFREQLPPSRVVKVSFTVTPQGSIKDLKFTTSLGYSEAEAAIISWLRRFRFSQISSNVEVTGTIAIKIDLE